MVFSPMHLLLIVLIAILPINSLLIDEEGYILYCPCMGRFGNQADHFLGALGFAHGINRTLVLPPWVEYRYGEIRSIQVSFDTYFNVTPLLEYHRVITMERFMTEIAPIVWLKENRVSFCYMARGNSGGCNAKDGNPFGPFWDTFNVDFIDSEFYGPLNYDVYHHGMDVKWRQKYPAAQWPVLAFTGAPASFPVQIENRILHKYLKWNSDISQRAQDYIKSTLPKGAFIGIHLRNGMDWIRACEHIKDSPNLFAAPQCLGYQNEKGFATLDMCIPSPELIIRQIKRLIKNSKEKPVKSVFVASDSNHMINELNIALKRMKVRALKLDQSNPHLELAILGRANYFIGNCISSFSAFVKRERDSMGFPSGFWAFPPEKSPNVLGHEEL